MKKYKFKVDNKKYISLNKIFRLDNYNDFNTLKHSIIENTDRSRYVIRYIKIEKSFFFWFHKTLRINVPPNKLIKYKDKDKYHPRDIHTDILIQIEDPNFPIYY